MIKKFEQFNGAMMGALAGIMGANAANAANNARRMADDDGHRRRMRMIDDNRRRRRRIEEEEGEHQHVEHNFEIGNRVHYHNPESQHDGKMGSIVRFRKDGKIVVRFDDGHRLAASARFLVKLENESVKKFENFTPEDPYGEEVWDVEEEERIEKKYRENRHREYAERLRREKKERDIHTTKGWVNERPTKYEEMFKKKFGTNPKVGDRVWNIRYGKGTVVRATKDWLHGWNYVNFDLILPDDIIEDREQNHATYDHGCAFGHGWSMKSNYLYKIIEE